MNMHVDMDMDLGQSMCIFIYIWTNSVPGECANRNALAPTLTTPSCRCFHGPFIHKEHTSTHTQGTDPTVALGAEGELPWMDLGAWYFHAIY